MNKSKTEEKFDNIRELFAGDEYRFCLLKALEINMGIYDGKKISKKFILQHKEYLGKYIDWLQKNKPKLHERSLKNLIKENYLSVLGMNFDDIQVENFRKNLHKQVDCLKEYDDILAKPLEDYLEKIKSIHIDYSTNIYDNEFFSKKVLISVVDYYNKNYIFQEIDKEFDHNKEIKKNILDINHRYKSSSFNSDTCDIVNNIEFYLLNKYFNEVGEIEDDKKFLKEFESIIDATEKKNSNLLETKIDLYVRYIMASDQKMISDLMYNGDMRYSNNFRNMLKQIIEKTKKDILENVKEQAIDESDKILYKKVYSCERKDFALFLKNDMPYNMKTENFYIENKNGKVYVNIITDEKITLSKEEVFAIINETIEDINLNKSKYNSDIKEKIDKMLFLLTLRSKVNNDDSVKNERHRIKV